MIARIGIVSLAISSLCPGQAAPEPAFVSGRVVDLNGVPLAEARVRMLSAAQQIQVITATTGFNAVTGVDGTFAFENVPAGQYTLRAERSGYISNRYQAPQEIRASFELTAGQRLTGATIRMTPESSISGRVTKSNDEPFAGIRVSVYRWTYQSGQRMLSLTGNPNTGADGRFTAGGLSPGTYYVSAQENEVLLTYYPNASQPSGASPIILTTGGSFSSADIRMRDDPVFHVRGRASNAATGAIPTQAIVWFYPAASNLDLRTFMRLPKLTPTGEFDIDRVPAGEYVLRVQVPRELNAEAEIAVKDRDIDNIQVLLRPGVEISARITTEAQDSQQPAPGRPQVLTFPSVNPAFGGQLGAPQDDGTYLFSNVGPWALRPLVAGALPPGMYIKSVRFGGEDITNSDHRFTSGGTMDVTLAARAAEVSGTLKDRDGKPLPRVTVSLWRPGAVPAGMYFPTRSTLTDTNGVFRIQGVPPGDYRVAAWEEIPQFADSVPEFRIQFEGVAKAVKLTENARETVEPVFIRRAAIEDAIARLR